MPGDVGFATDTATPARPLGRHYSLARARDPVAPRPLTAAAGPWRHPVLAWHSNRCVPCVSVVRPSGVYLLGRPGWREPLCLTPSTLKHSRTLLHLLAQRLPLSEWPRCSTESAAHDSTTTSYYMFFNKGVSALKLYLCCAWISSLNRTHQPPAAAAAAAAAAAEKTTTSTSPSRLWIQSYPG